MFKKIIPVLAALATLSACTEDFEDWASPIVNEGVPAVSESESAAAVVAAIKQAATEVNLAAMTDNTVKLVNVNLPENIAFKSIEANLVNGDKQNAVQLNESGEVSVEEMNAAVSSLFGRQPQMNDVKCALTAVVNLVGSTGSVPLTVALDPMQMKVQPVSPDVEESYSLVLNEANTALNHSDVNVYDDPVFTLTFEAKMDDEWHVVSKSGKVYGFDIPGDTTTDGTLIEDGEDGAIAEDGKFKLTFNAETKSFSLEAVKYEPFIYFIGATDGWSNAEQRLKLTDANTGTYTGFLYCADPNEWGNQFKFQRVAGDWGTELNNSHFTTYLGAATDCGGNLGVSGGENVYYFEVSLGNASIKATEILNMNLVGDFNGWNAGDPTQQMTWNAAEFCYEMTGAGVTANGWKFTANNEWTINLGGEQLTDLQEGGANISAVGTTIKLYPCRVTSDKYYATVE